MSPCVRGCAQVCLYLHKNMQMHILVFFMCVYMYMYTYRVCTSGTYTIHIRHIQLLGICGRLSMHMKFIILSDLGALQGSMEVVGRGEFSPPGSSLHCHSVSRARCLSGVQVAHAAVVSYYMVAPCLMQFLLYSTCRSGEAKSIGMLRGMTVGTLFVQVTNRCWSPYCLGAVQRHRKI